MDKKNTKQDCRFIPNRKCTNTVYSQYYLKENINPQTLQLPQQPLMQQNASEQSILAIQSQNIINNNNQKYVQLIEESILCEHKQQSQNNTTQNSQRVLQFNSQNQSYISQSIQPTTQKDLAKIPSLINAYENSDQKKREQKKYKRKSLLNRQPEKILDAPFLQDDFYLNIMDWGKQSLGIILTDEIFLWNQHSIVNLLKSSDTRPTSLQFMPIKPNILAVGFSDSTIQIWDTEKCIPLRTMKGHYSRVCSLSWNPSSPYILSSGSRDTTIINHDIRQQKNIISILQGHEQEVCGLKWSPEGCKLASGSNDNSLKIWDLNKNIHSLHQHKAAVKAIAWCPWQRNILATGGGVNDKTLKMWNFGNGDKNLCVNSVNVDSQVCSILWNPNDKELLTSHGFKDNQLILWNYQKTGSNISQITQFLGHTNRVLHLAIGPDEQTVCSASADETIRFWKIFEGPNNNENKNGCEEFIESFYIR